MNKEWITIKNQYRNKCYRCYATIYPGAKVEYQPDNKKIRHTFDCKVRLKLL